MNDPKTIANLLRAVANGTNAKASSHDVIFTAAADLLDVMAGAAPVFNRQADLPDANDYSNQDVAARMWESFNATGDRWYEFAAEKLERKVAGKL